MHRLVSLLVVAVSLGACTATPDEVPDGPAIQEVSGAMPVLEGETVDGGELVPADYEGRPVVVNFWATWCGPCRREQPLLSRAHAAQGPDGAAFIGIDYRDDAAAARAYLEEFSVAYPSLGDPAGNLAYRFGVPFLPTTIFIDAEGRLRYRVTGEIDEATLDRLLAEVASDAEA